MAVNGNGPKLADARGRVLRDLRISVTDRCNFRCVYCMPREVFGADYAFLDRKEVLSLEEIARLAGLFVRQGVRKIRLTGGEPLVRRGLETLVEKLAALPDLQDLSLTTNGSLLTPARARSLADAGLRRITVSLDALDDAVFKRVNDVNFPVAGVLRGIDAAAGAGLAPVKVNMVVKRGENEDQIVPMAGRFRGTGHIVRYIEYMDVGSSNGWELADVVSAREVVERIGAAYPLEPVEANYPGGSRQALAVPRWGRRDRGNRLGDPAVLRRVHTRPGSPPRASSIRASSRPPAATSGRCCGAAARTTRFAPSSPTSGAGATIATRSCAPPPPPRRLPPTRPPRRRRGSKCPTFGG